MSIDLMNSLLDSTVDDLSDLPVFGPKPNGTYKTQFNYRVEPGEKLPYFVFTFKILEIIELEDAAKAEELDLTKEQKIVFTAFPFKKDGDKSEFGEGMVKMIVAGLKEVFGGNTNGETLAQAQDGMVALTINSRKRKDKDTGEVKEENQLVAIIGVE